MTTPTLPQAAQIALDALERCTKHTDADYAAVTALREALAQPAAPSVHFTEATIDEYLEDYEMTDGEGGCHAPSEMERAGFVTTERVHSATARRHVRLYSAVENK